MTADWLNSFKGSIFSFGPSKNEKKNVINPKIIEIFPLVLKLCSLKIQWDIVTTARVSGITTLLAAFD